MALIVCHFCQGRRQTLRDDVTCSGCGMPAKNAVRNKQRRLDGPHCPKCGSTKAHKLENDERVCLNCRSHYGGVDFNFVDTRPDVNASKKGL